MCGYIGFPGTASPSQKILAGKGESELEQAWEWPAEGKERGWRTELPEEKRGPAKERSPGQCRGQAWDQPVAGKKKALKTGLLGGEKQSPTKDRPSSQCRRPVVAL